ncbi:MAG: class I SAM-dependent methyltransferase [Proteobacteria bacterium]|nr:class I SAM-dependent methyltransferase [Pseudomonadota bacterium]
MDGIGDLLARLDLQAGDRVLDIGCGGGVISQYISDQTGANVTGLDYAASAIALATERTAAKGSRLTFVEGDISALDYPAHSFDAVVSLDTLY